MSPSSFPRFVWFTVIPGLFLVAVAADRVELSLATIAIMALCAVCELMDSSLGMGYGTTLTPILLLMGFEPLQLVPTILVSELLSGFSASLFHAEAGNVRFARGSDHLRSAILLSVCSVFGILAGVRLAFHVSRMVLERIIAIVLISAGLYILFASSRKVAFKTWRVVVLALVASFNKAISGGGYGPLMTSGQVMSGIEARAAVAITSLAEGFTCLMGSILFLLVGKELDTRLLIPVATGALLSVPFSARIVRRMQEGRLKAAIALCTLLLAVVILVKTFQG